VALVVTSRFRQRHYEKEGKALLARLFQGNAPADFALVSRGDGLGQYRVINWPFIKQSKAFTFELN
jgi:hypothetical protein